MLGHWQNLNPGITKERVIELAKNEFLKRMKSEEVDIPYEREFFELPDLVTDNELKTDPTKVF